MAVRRPEREALIAAAGPPLVAAILGNSFVGRDALSWFQRLRHPGLQLPLPAFLAMATVYYLQLGIALYRAHHNDDHAVRNGAVLVLAGNELWNVGFFGRRSPRNGFWGLLVFLGPPLVLQRSVTSDPPSLLP